MYVIEYHTNFRLIILPFLPPGQLSDTISSVRKGCQAGCNNKMVPSNSNIVRGVNGKIVHSETYQGTQ